MLRDLILKFRREKTIILSSHEAEYLTLCDRIALLDKGKIVTVGTPEEVFSNIDLLKAHNLDIPPLIELFLELGLGMPKGVEEAKNILKELL